MEKHSRRMTHGDPRPAPTIITRAAIVFFFFHEAVVQHVTYVTVFCRVGRIVYPSWGTTPRNFQFSGTGVAAALQPVSQLGKTGRSLILVWWFLVRLLFFHCMPAGRHSDSTLHTMAVAPVAYQVILEPGIGQFLEFEPRRVHTRINSLGLFLVDKLTCGKRESVS